MSLNRKPEKIIALAIFAVCSVSANSVTAKGEATDTSQRPIYFSLGGGVAEYVGGGSDFVSTGGTVVAGVGWNAFSHVALEGEFIGSWANVAGGNAGSYSGIFGPRFFTSVSERSNLGVYIGTGIGVNYSEGNVCGFFCASAWEASFAWGVKGGLEYAFSEGVQGYSDVRYGATSGAPGDGIISVVIGVRLSPNW